MKTFILLALLTSQFAFAGEIVNKTFSIFPNSGRNRVYYSCSIVESETEKVVEALGAKVLRSNCFGGIQAGSNYPTPNSINVAIDRPAAESDIIEVVELKDSTNCHLVTTIVNNLKSVFPIEKIKGNGFCFNPGSSYRISISIRR